MLISHVWCLYLWALLHLYPHLNSADALEHTSTSPQRGEKVNHWRPAKTRFSWGVKLLFNGVKNWNQTLLTAAGLFVYVFLLTLMKSHPHSPDSLALINVEMRIFLKGAWMYLFYWTYLHIRQTWSNIGIYFEPVLGTWWMCFGLQLFLREKSHSLAAKCSTLFPC